MSSISDNYANIEYVMKEGIVNVDYVVKDNLYKNVIHEKFDLCYSSHNIEHTPCLITFLNKYYRRK